MNNKKFKIGDIVKIKDDLQVGAVYYNENTSIGDTFSSKMRNNLGKEAKIINIKRNGGYVLDIDKIHTYYDGMIEYPTDDLASEPYIFNHEVENIVAHLEREHYKKIIDEALDRRLHETNPEEFQELFKLCRQFI